MIAGAGGAMRATGWRATAPRFNNCGEEPWHRSLSGARARGQRRACEIDLRGALPAPAACAALCVAMAMVGGGRRRWFVGGRSIARRNGAGDDGPNAPRRDQHDTRRHPATSVSFWDGDRRLRSVSLAP